MKTGLPMASPLLLQTGVRGRWYGAALLVFVALMVAVLIGGVAGTGSLLYLMPLAALVGLLCLCFVPPTTLLWVLLAISLFAVGPLIYYAKIESSRWLSPALAAALFLPLVVDRLQAKAASAVGRGWPAPLLWYVVFLLMMLISSAWSSPSFAEGVFAFRTYFAYLPLAFVLMVGLIHPNTQERMWRFLLLCSAVQLPFVLYQVLVVARHRINQSALQDVVTGTFPGSVEYGGANAGVAVFTLTASLVAISLWRARRLPLWQMVVVGLSCLAVIVLAEVKAVVLMIPIALVALFWRELGRRPAQSLAWLLAGLVLAVAVFGAYRALYYTDERVDWTDAQKPMTPMESIRNQLDPQLAQRGLVIGRMAAYADWWHRTARPEEAAGLLFGYGAGSTQYGRLGVGEVMERLRYNADNTASGLVLWDAGIVGHLLLLVSFILAARAAFKLRDSPAVPVVHAAILHGVGVSWLVHLLCLPYKDFMFRAAPSQVLLFFMLGYVGYWARIAGSSAKAGRAPSRPIPTRAFAGGRPEAELQAPGRR